MIYDFTFFNPTRVHFGKTAMEHLPEELANFGENVLLLYGKNAIKKIGLYDEVIAILNASGKKVTELGGIKPNPSYAQVLEGARLVREHKVDLILAVSHDLSARPTLWNRRHCVCLRDRLVADAGGGNTSLSV